MNSIKQGYQNLTELNKYHQRLYEDLQHVKNTLYRLTQQVHTIETVIQPLFPKFPICSIKEARYVIATITKRIDEYSSKDFLSNIFRITVPVYYLDDISRDLHIITFGMESLMFDLQMFFIFMNQYNNLDPKQKNQMIKQIDKECKYRIQDEKDIEFKHIIHEIGKHVKSTYSIPSNIKKTIKNTMKPSGVKDIQDILKNNTIPYIKSNEYLSEVYDPKHVMEYIKQIKTTTKKGIKRKCISRKKGKKRKTRKIKTRKNK